MTKDQIDYVTCVIGALALITLAVLAPQYTGCSNQQG